MEHFHKEFWTGMGEATTTQGNDASLPVHKQKREIFKNDRLKLLNIFPEEIWRAVFSKLDNPEHLRNVSDSSVFCRYMLLPQRATYLFQAVWTILGSEYVTEFETAEHKSFTQEQLKLRLVCRSWCRAVDSFHQDHSFVLMKSAHWRWLIGDMLDECIPFLPHFAATHESTLRNPFWGRSVLIRPVPAIMPQEYFDGIIAILDKYGSHIWNLRIAFEDVVFYSGYLCTWWYSNIRNVLERVPNLRRLAIETHFFKRYDKHLLYISSSIKDLQAEVNIKPLAFFEKLEEIRVAHVLAPIVTHLICNNSHINSLALDRDSAHGDVDFYSVPLSKLNTLSINYCSKSDFLRLENPQINWRLTNLHLDLSSSTFIEWSRVFKVLRDRFKHTLTHLNLKLPATKAHRKKLLVESKKYKLQLFNLTHLDVTMYNLAYLDFLSPMKDSLEVLNLKVELSGKHIDEMQTLMKLNFKLFWNCTYKPLECKIWPLFPKLKIINFEFAVDLEYFSWSRSRLEWGRNRDTCQLDLENLLYLNSKISSIPVVYFLSRKNPSTCFIEI